MDHFTLSSTGPETRKEPEMTTDDEIDKDVEDQINKNQEEMQSGQSDSENEERLADANKSGNEISSQLLINQERFMEKLMNLIDRKIDQKLERLNLNSHSNDASGARKEPDVNAEQKFNEPRKFELRENRKVNPPHVFFEPLLTDEELENDYNQENQEGDSRSLRRHARPVADWKIRYDGRDEGKKLNKFIQEVEFTAEAEGLSRNRLYQEALHLFVGEARTWYINARQNEEFSNWSELVAELKLEFQPPDLDFHYEQQAVYRKQRRGEKFNEFYNAMNEYFSCMSVQPNEQRKFDIVFRNMRQDYRNVLVIKGVRNLKTLRMWGRKLDSANWSQYRNRESDNQQRTVQVNEINRNINYQRERPGGQGNSNSQWRKNERDNRNSVGKNPERTQPVLKPNPRRDEPIEGTSSGTLAKRIAEYKMPGPMVCFNCFGRNHYYKVCLQKPEIFCRVCGFHDFTTDRCPYCAKNGRKSS